MSKTHPNPGRLNRPRTFTIETQEQAHKILLSVPDISSDMQKQLIESVAAGPDMYWIAKTLQNRLYQGAGKASKSLCDILCRKLLRSKRAGHHLEVLRHQETGALRKRAMELLLSRPNYAWQLFDSPCIGLTRDEMEIVVERMMPSLTFNEAIDVFNRLQSDRFSPALRARVLATVRAVVDSRNLFYIMPRVRRILEENGREGLHPPLSAQERQDLLFFMAQEPSSGAEILVATFQKSQFGDCKLTQDEQVVLLKSVVPYLCSDAYRCSIASAMRYLDRIVEHGKEMLTHEQLKQLQDHQESLKTKAA